MRVLIACEFSGIVRDAFIAKGHDATSCDLLPTESSLTVAEGGNHHEGDIWDIMQQDEYSIWGRLNKNYWDLVIAHPPCTYLANSGVRWLHTIPGRWEQMEEAARFFRRILRSGFYKIAIENPVMHHYATDIIGRKHDQIIHPWQHGHGETKATCLWLKGLPPLEPSNIVEGREPRVHHESPGEDRWKNRSRTLPGIAQAMAEQWG